MVSVILSLVCACLCFVACNKGDTGSKTVECDVVATTQTQVVISVSALTGEWTLKECMEQLSADGKLTYTISNGMVTQINGKQNTGNSYWMSYISDTEFSNTGWGTVEYEGQTYASAIFGAEELPVKAGHTYIWSYQSF